MEGKFLFINNHISLRIINAKFNECNSQLIKIPLFFSWTYQGKNVTIMNNFDLL